MHTGLIVQVIEATDVRLLHTGPTYGKKEEILVAMKGSKNDQDGVSENIVELVETSAIPVATPSAPDDCVWVEWDLP